MKDYYSENALEFIESTMDCDMSTIYQLFEKHLDNAHTLLDVGFGSGRDSLYFAQKYEVYSLDPTREFCEHGVKLGLKHIMNIAIQQLEMVDYFDGIWACASLLHVSSNELNDVFKRCSMALKENGVMYCSFKLGNFEGVRNERFYLDLDEDSIKKYLADTNLKLVETMISLDVRKEHQERWLNCILKK